MIKHNYFQKIIFILFFAGCTANGNEEQNDEKPVFPVIEVFSDNVDLDIDYVADMHAAQNVEIRARVEGYLEEILVDEGRQVKKGQLLFKINDQEYRSELARAQAAIKTAEAEAKAAELEKERVKLLVDKGVVSKTELDLAEAKLLAAIAKIDEAKAAESATAVKLANTLIRSPFDGIIDRIPYKVGSLINEGTLLTTVSDISTVNAYFNVSEIEYLHYLKKRKDSTNHYTEVTLYLADGSEYPEKGKIETMESEIEESTGSIAFRARFKNPGGILKHGSSGRIRLKNTLKTAIIIPQKSVVEIQDKNYVFLLQKDNTVKMKSFLPKARKGHFYVVEKGLMPGEKIIYEGVLNLKEGMEIFPNYLSKETILSENQVN
jgi:membrane fusion protein (multidrug efflux system)